MIVEKKVSSYGSMARLYKFGHAESLSVVVDLLVVVLGED